MSRGATLSALGLYEWDNTIFDWMEIPAALDRETLIQNLLAETAELEILYPKPVVFKNLVAVWSRKQIDIWNRLYETTQYEYNPIENYDRMETGTTDGTGRTTHSGTDTTGETTTHGGTDSRTENMKTGGADTVTENVQQGGREGETTTGKITSQGNTTETMNDEKGHWQAGYNANTGTDDGLVKQSKDIDEATTETNTEKTDNSNGSKTTTFGKTEAKTLETEYGKSEQVAESMNYGQTINRQETLAHGETVETENGGSHTLRAHGNIGVTTTQEMIQQQRRIELFNMYDIIIEDFKMRFCIMIY